MADEAKIKQKIVLEGEKEYSSAIKAANRDLRTLRTEMKAETAELGKNATAQQKAEVKARSLQKQIREQEKIVKACRDALDEVRKKYGDNEDAVAKYEQKLNGARTALANMRSELDETGDAFQEFGDDARESNVEVKAFADAVSEIGSAGSAISTFIGDTFKGMLGTVRTAATEVWDTVTDIAAKANNYTDLASYYGSSASQIQQFDNAISDAAGNFGDFINLVNLLSYGGKDKQVAELLGLSNVNYSNNIEFAYTALQRLAELRGKLSQSQYDDIMSEIFGAKKSQSVNWFVSNLDAVTRGLERYDAEAGGFGMDSEQLAAMNDLWVQVNGIQTMWSAFKSSFMAGAFGQLGLNLTGDAQGFLEALNAFMNAEDQGARDEALQDMKESLRQFFQDLGTALSEGIRTLDEVGQELQTSEDGTVRTIGRLLSGISGALEWFTREDNIQRAVDGFKALLAVWAGGEIVGAAGKLASLAANIALVKAASAGGGVAGSAGAAGSAGTGAAAAASGGTAGTFMAGGSTHGWMSNLLGIAGVGAIYAGFAAAAKERLSNINIRGSENAIVQAAGGDEKLMKAFETYIGAKNAAEAYAGGTEYDEAKAEAMVDTLNDAQEAFFGMAGAWELMDKYSAWLQENGYGAMDGRVPEFMQAAAGEAGGSVLSEAQRAALEDWWDLMRRTPEDDLDSPVWDEFDAMWPELQSLFSGNEALLTELENRLDEQGWGNGDPNWRSFEDIPASVFEGLDGMNGASRSLDSASATMKGLPALMQAAVRSGVSNIKVYIDGQEAGRILSPFISQGIAKDIM